jgi:hypothetical protein
MPRFRAAVVLSLLESRRLGGRGIVLKSLLLGLGMLVFGGALAFGGGRSLYRAWSSERWPVAQAKVISSSVDKLRTRRSVSFMPRVKYEYSVDGKSYTADTLAFGAGISAGALEDANDYVHHYPVGASVQIHYSPDEAAVACLDCGKVGIPDYIVAAGGAGLLVLAILGLIETVRSHYKARNRARGQVAVRGAGAGWT